MKFRMSKISFNMVMTYDKHFNHRKPRLRVCVLFFWAAWHCYIVFSPSVLLRHGFRPFSVATATFVALLIWRRHPSCLTYEKETPNRKAVMGFHRDNGQGSSWVWCNGYRHTRTSPMSCKPSTVSHLRKEGNNSLPFTPDDVSFGDRITLSAMNLTNLASSIWRHYILGDWDDWVSRWRGVISCRLSTNPRELPLPA